MASAAARQTTKRKIDGNTLGPAVGWLWLWRRRTELTDGGVAAVNAFCTHQSAEKVTFLVVSRKTTSSNERSRLAVVCVAMSYHPPVCRSMPEWTETAQSNVDLQTWAISIISGRCLFTHADESRGGAVFTSVVCVFVCFLQDISETDAARITKFDIEMFQTSPGKPFILGPIGQRSRSWVTKTLPVCTFALLWVLAYCDYSLLP